jgi:hypothetical protein
MLTLEDGDVPPGAYADGRIADRSPDATDSLTALRLPVPRPGTRDRVMAVEQIEVSNSALGGDGVLAVSRDGLYAVVATTHGRAGAGAARVEGLPTDARVRLLDVNAWPPRELAVAEVAPGPVAAAFDPSGDIVAVVCRPTRQLVLLQALENRFGAAVFVDLAGALGFDAEPSGVSWSPDGSLLCVTTGAPGSMSFWRVDWSEIREPLIEQVGQTLQFGAYLRSPHWTLLSREVIVADAGWPSASSGVYILEPEGGVHIVRAPVEEQPARWLQSVLLAPAPQAIALDPAGRTVASVAMRRQDLFAGSQQLGGVLTTIRVADSSLELLGSTACGSLPHDAAFGSDGRDVVVADFATGRFEIFSLDAFGVPVFTGVRIETGYGPHQVEVLP